MKKKFEKAEVKAVLLNNCIITTSGDITPTNPDQADHTGDGPVTDPHAS